jgi:hypothetical protein
MPLSVYKLYMSDCYAFPSVQSATKVSAQWALSRLASNPCDREALALVIDTDSWIVEEEVSYRFGTPSWFPTATVIVFLEIVSAAANYAPERHQHARWIRAMARRAALRLEHILSNDPTGLGVIQSKSSRRDLESLLTDLLNGRVSPFWADLRQHGSPTNPRYGSPRGLKEV